MSKTLILESPNATLWYHPEDKIVHHSLHKFTYGQELYDLLLAGTELIEKHGAKKWLSNDLSNTVLRKEDSDWGNENWFPRTLKAGWKHWAIVQPKATIAKMNMDKLVKDYSAVGINAKFFSDENEALEWLKKQ